MPLKGDKRGLQETWFRAQLDHSTTGQLVGSSGCGGCRPPQTWEEELRAAQGELLLQGNEADDFREEGLVEGPDSACVQENPSGE